MGAAAASIVGATPNQPVPVRPIALKPGEGETLSVVGETVRVLADGAATHGRCFIFEEATPPGMGPPLHRHAIDDEFFYILEGRFRFVRDGQEFIAERGAFVSTPRGSLHTFSNIGPGIGRMLIITMPAGLEGPFRETDAAGKKGATTPEMLAAMFGKFSLTFEGPPLGR